MQCASNPVPIGVGYLGQYLIKPLLGFLIAKVSLPSLLPPPFGALRARKAWHCNFQWRCRNGLLA